MDSNSNSNSNSNNWDINANPHRQVMSHKRDGKSPKSPGGTYNQSNHHGITPLPRSRRRLKHDAVNSNGNKRDGITSQDFPTIPRKRSAASSTTAVRYHQRRGPESESLPLPAHEKDDEDDDKGEATGEDDRKQITHGRDSRRLFALLQNAPMVHVQSNGNALTTVEKNGQDREAAVDDCDIEGVTKKGQVSPDKEMPQTSLRIERKIKMKDMSSDDGKHQDTIQGKAQGQKSGDTSARSPDAVFQENILAPPIKRSHKQKRLDEAHASSDESMQKSEVEDDVPAYKRIKKEIIDDEEQTALSKGEVVEQDIQQDAMDDISNESEEYEETIHNTVTPKKRNAKRAKKKRVLEQMPISPSRRSCRKASHDAVARIIQVHQDEDWDPSHDVVLVSSVTRKPQSKKSLLKAKRSLTEESIGVEATKKKRRRSRTTFTESNETLQELNKNDVVCGTNPEHPRNQRYHAFVMEVASKVGPEYSMHDAVASIGDDVFTQEPPGRFLRIEEETPRLLKREERFQKIRADIHEVLRARKKKGGKPTPDKANGNKKRQVGRRRLPGIAAVIAGNTFTVTQTSKNEKSYEQKSSPVAENGAQQIQMPDSDFLPGTTEMRNTDVLGGSISIQKWNAGTTLFHELLSKQDPAKDAVTVVDEIVAAIHAQSPCGRFWSRNITNLLTDQQVRRKITKSITKRRNLMTVERPPLQSATSANDDSEKPTINEPDSEPIIADSVARDKLAGAAIDGPASERTHEKLSEILKRKASLPDVQLDTYVEDVAWRMFAVQEEEKDNLKPLPPPAPLPSFPADSKEASCTWDFNISSRVLRVKIKPGEKQFSLSDKMFLQSMMERDDIAVITEGHCDTLDAHSWTLGSIKSKAGEKYHHRFRRFKRTLLPDESNEANYKYEEADRDVCMKMQDYIDYLQTRSKAIKEHRTKKRSTPIEECFAEVSQPAPEGGPEFTFTDNKGEHITLDVLEDNIYMLDYDVKKQLPSQYQDFKDNFRFPEFLPGGAMCLMNSVNEAARPDMGPNLYITPPGTFTRFHQDGFGTVDSGHLCMAGYNEVVMFRRLPPGHERNAINIEGSNLYEMPHADKLGKKALDWPKKALIERLNDMNYCAIVLVLGPGELLHIGKGRFHAFRKLGAEILREDDCHFHLRRDLHAKLRGRNESAEQLVNMSLAWDWSYSGVTPEGINREMTSTLEFALRNRNFSAPKESLAIPKLSLISSCDTAISELEKSASQFDFTIGKVNNDKMARNNDILKGLLPTLEFVVHLEEDAYDLAETNGTAFFDRTSIPNAWENSQTFPLDPFGNSDYFCKICYQELSNAYMHCNGCEDLLTKDLNICTECHSGLKHKRFIGMNVRSQRPNSSLNHTGSFTAKQKKNCKCTKKTECVACQRCCECSCTCHGAFSFQQRMWDNSKLSYIVRKAKDIVGDDRVEYFDEVEHRLREAMEFRPVGEVDTHIPEVPIFSPPKLLHQHFELEPYEHASIKTAPSNALDISKEAMAFTAPLPEMKLLAMGGMKCELISALQLKEFLFEAKNTADGDAISELAPTGFSAIAAVQLYRNFIDCDKVMYIEKKDHLFFTPRELDIISYALLQVREKKIIPVSGKNSVTAWGSIAWSLMSYRLPRKNLIDRFYIRTNSKQSWIGKLTSSLENKAYVHHLEQHIAPLFEYVL